MKDFLRWFGHVERIENDRIGKMVYVGKCVGGPRNRWIDTVKERLKKRSLDVSHARRMVHDRSVARGMNL